MVLLKLFLAMNLIINCVFEKATTKCGDSPLIVTLPQGKVKGSYDLHKSQIKFLGIPYASVDEKYQAPGKPTTWNGTFNADRGSIKCKQYEEKVKMVIGQEDCLVLNVFIPIYREEKPLPVMVFLHGGGYFWGSNTDWIYNPRFLVEDNVIVVTINYRLSALGFLCLPLKDAPGNAGLKDQIAALKWIQNNIAYFGGDPDSVTLFGQSSGGASVNYLLLTYSATGLFHRAIIESGTILTPHFFNYNPIESASTVAQRLGYNTSNPDELLKIYKNTSVDDIIEASTRNTKNNPYASYVFGPCVETAITTRRPLITDTPRELLKKTLNISAIIGFNNKEGIQWASSFVPITKDKIIEHFENIVPKNMIFKNKADLNSFKDDVLSIYFSNGSATDNLIDYFTDSVIRYPLMTVSEHLRKKPNRTIYNYYYTYDSKRNLNKFLSSLPYVPGADHADELFVLFDPIVFNLLPSNSKDRAMIANMTKFWTSFARIGEPSNPEIKWHHSEEQLNFIKLGEEIIMTTLPNEDRIAFWREAYNKYGRT